jgi:hypothetical protein
MAQFHRFGHLDTIRVRAGQQIKKGEKIGTIGTGNGQWSAHLHYDCPNKKFSVWTEYVIGWEREKVRDTYTTPYLFIDKKREIPMLCDHLGYNYLEKANYSGKAAWHPGVDMNGPGAGNSDVGLVIRSVCDGVVVYVYDGKDKNGGWGKLLVIQEEKIVPQIVPEPEPEVVLEEHAPIVNPIDIAPPEEPKQAANPMTFLDFLNQLIQIIFKK